MAKNKKTEPVISTASRVTDNPKYLPDRDHPMSIDGDFTISVVGDIVQTRSVTQLDDDPLAVQGLQDLLEVADVEPDLDGLALELEVHRLPGLAELAVDDRWRPLHDERRFQELAKRVGLPEPGRPRPI